MNRIAFYALRNDILPILDGLERTCHVRFIDMNDNKNPTPREWTAAKELPDLGKAKHETGRSGDKYMVVQSGTPIIFSTSMQNDGRRRFDLYQVNNAESIVMAPAGEWKDDVILAGEFTVMLSTPISRKLMRAVYGRIRATFKKIGNYYWVGPEALRRLESGARLTPAEQSPPEFDLRGSMGTDSLAETTPHPSDSVTPKGYTTTTMEELRKMFGGS